MIHGGPEGGSLGYVVAGLGLLLCAAGLRPALLLLLAQGGVVAIAGLMRAWDAGAPMSAAAVLLAVVLMFHPARLLRSAGDAEAGRGAREAGLPALGRFALAIAVVVALVLLVPGAGYGMDGVPQERLLLVLAAGALGLVAAATGGSSAMRGVGLLAMGHGAAFGVAQFAGPVLTALCAVALLAGGMFAVRPMAFRGGAA